ncbi:MAG: hypothetical protein LBV67_00750 [Streptococcaceae bacterium]|jgi:hypothetical protein|nr:hypothetical protein [Streptococcaceae bacterium]
MSTKLNDMVPIQIVNPEPPQVTQNKEKNSACTIKCENLELTIFNGIDKQILLTILKAVKPT